MPERVGRQAADEQPQRVSPVESRCTVVATLNSLAPAIALLLTWRPQRRLMERRGTSAQLKRCRCRRLQNIVLAFMRRLTVLIAAVDTVTDRDMMAAVDRCMFELTTILVEQSTTLTTRGSTIKIVLTYLSGMWC